MLKKRTIYIVMAVFSIVIIFGLIYLNTYKLKNFIPAIHFSCKLENNCCTKKEECKYVWYTGSCNTPEYVDKLQKKSNEQGITNSEVPFRENVACSCESNKCVVKN